jgi:hypothetical protein
MSMTTHVIGFRPPDATWTKMKEAWDACRKAGVSPPKEVQDFFNWENPDDAGVEVDLHKAGCIRDYSADSASGYEVDVSKLPPGVSIIRVYNSW